jgi:DNA invertase Pin-like site-specific DNA recombinase
MNTSNKVTAEHLRRLAYLYVRQSTLRQVHENRESTARQYDLKRRAQVLGWAVDQIVVIDEDLGLSGATADNRNGFQRLVAEVGLGRVGLVMGLEVSRLARSSTDWHRLLEICALADTLILDEDGIYDPGHFNDRLLLGLKGTMSEAELHLLRARLIGGQLNKARRGDLWMKPPIGFVYDSSGRVVFDPDQQVQRAVRSLFETFRQTGSALRVVHHFKTEGVLWPRRITSGVRAGELLFGPLEHSRVLGILHNPRYTGAFVYGRTRQRKVIIAGQLRYRRLKRDEWSVFLPNMHPGYISWEEFESNQSKLLANARGYGEDRRSSPPREGSALLQGLVLCGVCGLRMTVRYHTDHGHLIPEYVCQRRGIQTAQPICQHLPGGQFCGSCFCFSLRGKVCGVGVGVDRIGRFCRVRPGGHPIFVGRFCWRAHSDPSRFQVSSGSLPTYPGLLLDAPQRPSEPAQGYDLLFFRFAQDVAHTDEG